MFSQSLCLIYNFARMRIRMIDILLNIKGSRIVAKVEEDKDKGRFVGCDGDDDDELNKAYDVPFFFLGKKEGC